MNTLNYLYLALEQKTESQRFYNEHLLRVTNPAARQLFASLRDDETALVTALQKEIESIASRPFPLNKIITGID